MRTNLVSKVTEKTTEPVTHRQRQTGSSGENHIRRVENFSGETEQQANKPFLLHRHSQYEALRRDQGKSRMSP